MARNLPRDRPHQRSFRTSGTPGSDHLAGPPFALIERGSLMARIFEPTVRLYPRQKKDASACHKTYIDKTPPFLPPGSSAMYESTVLIGSRDLSLLIEIIRTMKYHPNRIILLSMNSNVLHYDPLARLVAIH